MDGTVILSSSSGRCSPRLAAHDRVTYYYSVSGCGAMNGGGGGGDLGLTKSQKTLAAKNSTTTTRTSPIKLRPRTKRKAAAVTTEFANYYQQHGQFGPMPNCCSISAAAAAAAGCCDGTGSDVIDDVKPDVHKFPAAAASMLCVSSAKQHQSSLEAEEEEEQFALPSKPSEKICVPSYAFQKGPETYDTSPKRPAVKRRPVAAVVTSRTKFTKKPSTKQLKLSKSCQIRHTSFAEQTTGKTLRRLRRETPVISRKVIVKPAAVQAATLPEECQQQQQPKAVARQSLMSDYGVQIRKSARQPQALADLSRQRNEQIMLFLLKKYEDDLVKHFFSDEKGYGVVAGRCIKKSEFICEYAGDLLTAHDAEAREKHYQRLSTAHQVHTGCYMYFFKYVGQMWCVDATFDDGRFGRLINHSRFHMNVKPQVLEIDGKPRLYFIARRDIEAGEELLYDYGERRPEVVKNNPWLKNS